MTLLLAGLVLFTAVHLLPTLAPRLRSGLRARLGEGAYKGIFSALLLTAIALISIGWRGINPDTFYMPSPAWHYPALALLFVSFLLLVVSNRPSRLCQWVRHPQLTGVALWGGAHLLLNGELRSTVLFGWLALWAMVEIVLINRREGVWLKGATPDWGTELVTLLITGAAIALVIAVHPWIAGLPVRW